MYRVELLPGAIADLVEIREYVASDSDSDAVAEKLMDKLDKKMQQLELFPESGKLLREKYAVSNSYRFIVCEKYMIFYKFANDVVTIVRVIYGRRDFLRILFPQ